MARVQGRAIHEPIGAIPPGGTGADQATSLNSRVDLAGRRAVAAF